MHRTLPVAVVSQLKPVYPGIQLQVNASIATGTHLELNRLLKLI